ncbi:MAG: DUF4142 domain-containing protein [Chitinophagales bacterium]
MKKILWALALVAVAGCSKNDDNNTKNNNQLNNQDEQFMAMAKEANVAEIDAGQIAMAKGNSITVVNFGSWMVSDHTTARNSLDSMATALGKSYPDTLSAAHQSMKQMLNNANGHSFDTTYIGGQVRDHQKVIQMFQNEINSGQHSAVKGYASRFLPHIQMHYNTADSIRMAL